MNMLWYVSYQCSGPRSLIRLCVRECYGTENKNNLNNILKCNSPVKHLITVRNLSNPL
jgi:hypothetical protein